MSNKNIKKNYFELLELRNVLIKLINGDWNHGKEKITAKLEFKLSIFVKIINDKFKYYDDLVNKVVREHVVLDEKGNFVFDDGDDEKEEKVKGDDSDKIKKNKDFKYLSEDDKKECNKRVKEIHEEEIELNLPVEIKLSDFIDKYGNLLELGGYGFLLTDFVNLDE